MLQYYMYKEFHLAIQWEQILINSLNNGSTEEKLIYENKIDNSIA